MCTLGQRIREIRLKMGIKQTELSKGICAPSMISQIESDRAKPSHKMLFAIADKLNVTLDRFLEGVDYDLDDADRLKMVNTLLDEKMYASAIPFLQELLRKESCAEQALDLEVHLANCYAECDQGADAQLLFERVLDGLARREDHARMTRVLMQLGGITEGRHEYQIAHYHLHRAMQTYRRLALPDEELYVGLLFQLASVHQKIGLVEKAEEQYAEVVELCTTHQNLRGLSTAYLRMAEMYERHQDAEKACHYGELALGLLQQLKEGTAAEEMELRLILLRNKERAAGAALPDLLAYADQCEAQGRKKCAGRVYADVALICLEQGDVEQADTFARQAVEQVPYHLEAAGLAHQALAFVAFSREQDEAAQRHLDQAMAVYERLGLLPKLEQITSKMCRHLAQQGRLDEVYKRMDAFLVALLQHLEQRGVA